MNLEPTTTVDLKRGDRVRLFNGLVRTVDEVIGTEYVSVRDERLYAVVYQEGDSDEWGGANTAAASTRWVKLTEQEK
jgi:hypothetical protein